MKYIYNYKDYDNKDKVQWIKSDSVNSAVENPRLIELIDMVMDELFDLFLVHDNIKRKLDNRKPILKFGNHNADIYTLLSFSNVNPEHVYNTIEESKKSSDKKEWHELFGDKEYLPKTVTNTREIKKLEFPIIAKPSKGHSGIGIMKFDTFEECEKEISKDGCELDTFSEMIKDIDTEYRFMFVKNDAHTILERVPIEKENKTILTKKPNETLSFVYIEQDKDKFEDMDAIKKIADDFYKHIDLDFCALDIMLDKNGKYWLIESNSCPGMGANNLANSYSAIYKDFYDKDVPEDKQQLVDYVCSEYYKEINKLYPNEMKKSKIPKIYE